MIFNPVTSMWDVKASVRVNTVNCVGIMGKGVALDFRHKYPAMFSEYKIVCGKGLLRPGGVWVWYGEDCTVLNAATKSHWKDNSNYAWITECLENIRNWLWVQPRRHVVTVPALGCGNGGLNWNLVRDIISAKLGDLNHHVCVFSPK